MHSAAVITAEGVRKRYGETVAVDGVSFDVRRGEIFGIIGPNGAGKTTTVEALVGLREIDDGRVRVLGLDPRRQRRAVAQRVGIQLQQAKLPDRMRVWEALDLFSSFYAQTVPWEPLLAQWGLAEKRHTPFDKLSGGQQQRLFIALALLNDPDIVVLDELTTGLDPQARRATWELVAAIREQGKTVVLVTHFMDEAEALCDRMAIIDEGRVIALDTPQALIAAVQPEARVIFSAPKAFDVAVLENVADVSHVAQQNGRVTVYGRGPLLFNTVLALHERGLAPNDIRVEQPSLEDVFIALTGRQMRD